MSEIDLFETEKLRRLVALLRAIDELLHMLEKWGKSLLRYNETPFCSQLLKLGEGLLGGTPLKDFYAAYRRNPDGRLLKGQSQWWVSRMCRASMMRTWDPVDLDSRARGLARVMQENPSDAEEKELQEFYRAFRWRPEHFLHFACWHWVWGRINGAARRAGLGDIVEFSVGSYQVQDTPCTALTIDARRAPPREDDTFSLQCIDDAELEDGDEPAYQWEDVDWLCWATLFSWTDAVVRAIRAEEKKVELGQAWRPGLVDLGTETEAEGTITSPLGEEDSVPADGQLICSGRAIAIRRGTLRVLKQQAGAQPAEQASLDSALLEGLEPAVQLLESGKGHVAPPAPLQEDHGDYVSASEILNQHDPKRMVVHMTALKRILNKHLSIRRRKPKANRLDVHLGDWAVFYHREYSTPKSGPTPAEIEQTKAELRRAK